MLPFSIIFIFSSVYCDWASEWLNPVEYESKNTWIKDTNNYIPKLYRDNNIPTLFADDDIAKVLSEGRYIPFSAIDANDKVAKVSDENFTPANFKTKLEETLKCAKALTAALKKQILVVENRERTLKQAIVEGRSGVTVLSVTSLGRLPRTYMIRDGFWALCNGIVQYPVPQNPPNMFPELFSAPRCIGQEVTSRRDPCVFTSIIKYETIPMTRRTPYKEDDYLCLKTSFNSSFENYMSVPRQVVDETCKNGLVKTIDESVIECGLRTLSEYSYYPHRDETTSNFPFEYCTEKDGSCKLLVGWHVSNVTIEKFEFLKSDQNFKKFFITTDSSVEPLI